MRDLLRGDARVEALGARELDPHPLALGQELLGAAVAHELSAVEDRHAVGPPDILLSDDAVIRGYLGPVDARDLRDRDTLAPKRPGTGS